jgi:hypothetical protein
MASLLEDHIDAVGDPQWTADVEKLVNDYDLTGGSVNGSVSKPPNQFNVSYVMANKTRAEKFDDNHQFGLEMQWYSYAFLWTSVVGIWCSNPNGPVGGWSDLPQFGIYPQLAYPVPLDPSIYTHCGSPLLHQLNYWLPSRTVPRACGIRTVEIKSFTADRMSTGSTINLSVDNTLTEDGTGRAPQEDLFATDAPDPPKVWPADVVVSWQLVDEDGNVTHQTADQDMS